MIRNKKEYNEARQRLGADEAFIGEQRKALESLELTSAEIHRAMQPALSFHAQLLEEVRWYERVRARDFDAIQSLGAIGRLLIAARIANGVTQRELAERLGVSEAQVSRDERNEYHGITVDRAQRILDALDEKVTARIEKREVALTR